MIIGNGMIAKSFKKYNDNNNILIFASGVSNSRETKKDSFYRERLLLENAINNNPEKVLVYFSTCSICDKFLTKTSYVRHKKELEDLIKKRVDKFYIFRLPQVVGNSSSPTLVKFLFDSILNNERVGINQNSKRNLICESDVFFIADHLIKNNLYCNEITNIATPNNTPVIHIVKNIEKITGLSLNYHMIDSGYSFDINIDKIQNLNIKSRIFDLSYLQDTLSSYFLRIHKASPHSTSKRTTQSKK